MRDTFPSDMDKEKCDEAIATKRTLADTTAGDSYKLPAGRKGTFDRAKPVKSAIALLSTKVTKPASYPALIDK